MEDLFNEHLRLSLVLRNLSNFVQNDWKYFTPQYQYMMEYIENIRKLQKDIEQLELDVIKEFRKL